MSNSNKLYIDVLTSRIHVDRALDAIDKLLLTASGTPDDRKKNLRFLVTRLEKNIEIEKQALAGYIQMIRSITGPKAGDMKRSAFNGLSPSARMLFIENGGKLID